MSLDTDQQRLSQEALLKWLRQEIAPTELVTVSFSDVTEHRDFGIHCALIPTAKIEDSLSNLSWDLSSDDGLPGAVQYYHGDEKQVEYIRYGNDNGIEPLVIDRYFDGIRPDYHEISEEFRLFHRLYHDRKLDQFFKIDRAGNGQLVAIIEANRVQIRLLEIRQFLAIKEMHLAILFDCSEYSPSTLDELKLKEGGEDRRDDLMCWGLYYGNLGGFSRKRGFSRLLGKRLIPPLPQEKSGFWGFAEEEPKKHVDFIIGTDEDGSEICYTSDPDALANHFGANPEAPHYLTPVHFRKEVLDKYYQQPGKFSVEDSILRCGHLWGMMMDNHHDDKVCAWLGDLGRDLPYEDQLHWRSYNIPPVGGVSKTYFRRQILAQATNSDRPEHIFQNRYLKLNKTCEERLGWYLLLPLGPGDQHHFQCVRVPFSDEQRDFDDLVGGLAKILIDSLNEKELNRLIPSEKQADLKGSIARLEAAFAAQGVTGAEDHIAFLRKLQNLRSSGSAHRKGNNYNKIATEFNVDSQNLRSVLLDILQQAIGVLDYFIEVVLNERLSTCLER